MNQGKLYMISTSAFRSFLLFLLVGMFTAMNCSVAKAEANLNLTAQTAILIEQTTGKTLYAKDERKRMYPASMTKLLTALVTLDYLQPEDMVVVGEEIKSVPWDSSKAHHAIGESITVENLLRGLMILSGNDTGCVLAMNVAQKEADRTDLGYNEAEKIFCELMNNKAKSLGANDSHFSNPHGYHNEAHYTTAYDMALIATAYMDNELLRKIAREERFFGNGAGENPDPALKTQIYDKEGHNNLVLRDKQEYYPFATGIKTGFTNEASDCLAASAEKGDVKLISVVFFSPDPGRYNDSKILFEYGFNTFAFETLQTKGEVMGTMPIANHKLGEAETVDLVAKSEYTGFYSKDELLTIQGQKSIVYDDAYIHQDEEGADTQLKLAAPIAKGAVIGKVTYTLNGETVFEDELLSALDIEERTFESDARYYWERFKSSVFTLKAIPYWLGVIGVIAVICMLLLVLRRRRERNFYKMRRRY